MAKRKNITCVKYNDSDRYGWVSHSTADKLINDGKAIEWNPSNKKKTKRPEKPKSDLPQKLPGRNHFKEAGKDFEAVKKLAEKEALTSISGIGKSTEYKINEFLEAN